MLTTFLTERWIVLLFGLLSSAIIAYCRHLSNKFQQYRDILDERNERELEDLIEEKLIPVQQELEETQYKFNAIKESYRYRLIFLCEQYLDRGYLTPKEYSSLSELAYILDEKNLLSLCEYYGGTTITIPKIEDLELLLCGISVFKAVHLDNIDMEDSLERYKNSKFSLEDIKLTYLKVSETMSSFKFGGQNER